MIQDLSGSWCIKGTGESTLVMDSSVPLIHHDPDRSWIIDPDPDHPKGTQPKKDSPPRICKPDGLLKICGKKHLKGVLLTIDSTPYRY